MKILFATDGSDTAQAALDLLQSFPFPEASEVTLLTVMDKDVFTDEGYHGLSSEQRTSLRETEDTVREEVQQFGTKEAERLREAGLSTNTLMRTGHPADEIVSAAEELGVDLVVLGSHGLTGLKRFLLGGVSTKVLAHAPCSVLIVKGTHDHRAAGDRLRLLLAYDDSAAAKEAAQFCAKLPLGDQVEVTAVNVLPLVTLFRQDIAQQLSWLWKEKKRVAEEALEHVKNGVSWLTSNVETQLHESSDVAGKILEVAEEQDSDLIVVGYKGKGAVEKFLIGTITARVAAHAPYSVLAVRS